MTTKGTGIETMQSSRVVDLNESAAENRAVLREFAAQLPEPQGFDRWSRVEKNGRIVICFESRDGRREIRVTLEAGLLKIEGVA